MVDKIIKAKKRNHRLFCSFYTESDPILTYMVKRLNLVKGDYLLEPCAGGGVFIDKILATFDEEFRADILDLNAKAVDNLKRKFGNKKIFKIRQADTLTDTELDKIASNNGKYTKIIGNPPYGAWQDKKRRLLLKNKYKGYVKETYALFIKRSLDLLKENGRLVFIVPDTFLALHMHKDLRKRLVDQTTVEDILLIPSKFFPGVNFGYSNLCIISFLKTKPNKSHTIRIASVKESINDLYKIAEGDYRVAEYVEDLPQLEIKRDEQYSFFLNVNKKLRKLLRDSEIHLGDIADCVTGFYSGDNHKFILTNVDTKLVEFNPSQYKNILDGLGAEKKYIPIVKGRGNPLINGVNYYIKWDKASVMHYKIDKKARFQNSRYYFKEGIGVPMVKTKKSKAFLLEKRLFDQSVVGVFPKNKRYLTHLLLFLNSEIANKLIHAINHTSNNSANYLKRLPLKIDEGDLKKSKKIFESYRRDRDLEKAFKAIDDLFNKICEV